MPDVRSLLQNIRDEKVEPLAKHFAMKEYGRRGELAVCFTQSYNQWRLVLLQSTTQDVRIPLQYIREEKVEPVSEQYEMKVYRGVES
jgi:hypothetical protein